MLLSVHFLPTYIFNNIGIETDLRVMELQIFSRTFLNHHTIELEQIMKAISGMADSFYSHFIQPYNPLDFGIWNTTVNVFPSYFKVIYV